MDETEQLLSLIGDIYDAALNPALWPGVIEEIARYVGGSGAAMSSRDSLSKTSSVYCDYGVTDRYRRLYFDKYFRFDPLDKVYLCLEVGEVSSNSNIIPHPEFIQTRFYKEWAKPQGFVDNVLTVLEKSATSFATFTVFRHERDGLADDGARERMRHIVPHLRRAVHIGRVIDLKTAEADTFADSLDGLSAGMFLVDSCGHILHANASGQAMLAEASPLRLAAGKLAANDADAEQALRDVFLAAESGDAGVGIKGIAVPLIDRDGERHVAHVLPLTSGARRRAGATYAAIAAIFVHKAMAETPSPPEVIAKTYRLTPTELRILLAIVEIGGARDVADALGIAESTVRTHLGRIYEKTGARRHTDLAKLLAGFSSPIGG
jgi:DNA-binding CsgD family transcriptional regulator